MQTADGQCGASISELGTPSAGFREVNHDVVPGGEEKIRRGCCFWNGALSEAALRPEHTVVVEIAAMPPAHA